MHTPRFSTVAGVVGLLALSGFVLVRAQDDEQLTVSHPECSYFGKLRDKFQRTALRSSGATARATHPLSDATRQVSAMLSYVPGGSRTYNYDQTHAAGSIDSYIFDDFKANNITPAPMTTDWEFIRRVTLDLTGRIPKPDRVLSFVADTSSDKRAKLVDELLGMDEWVDKWTMYFGDLYQNTDRKPSTGLQRFPQGRNAFYQWIHDSLAANKPYNQMATALITAAGGNSWDDGTLDYPLNGFISGGPNQDIADQMTSFVFDTFMGMTHVNCVLCHNGRGHLDQLSLWGSQTTRYEAWQLASYLSHTQLARVPAGDPSNPNAYYWSVQDNTRNFTLDYTLNTTTGNRPARTAPAGCKSGQPCFYVPPEYIFNGDKPRAGENYRVALARDITGDFQFARATVNYMWAQFFGRGIVDPPDTFDPARLDPDNPPPAPWTLQPSNAKLLNALAQHFVASGYNLKSLMREIATSQTYQFSSRYTGTWNDAWEPYFARKFVRRLWAEEVHDAVVQSSGNIPVYTVPGFTELGHSKVSYAMMLPDVVGGIGDGNASNLLDSFFRGNRDDQARKSDGSILQALSLMNNVFVENRIQYTGANATPLITQNLSKSNSDLVNTVYLAILSRLPSSAEMAKAQAAMPTTPGTARSQAVQDLVWSLYNKVDFIFNY
ncbi:MAG TPA: DUF1549 domain-containing protein [Bryobacteraceae bacterium]